MSSIMSKLLYQNTKLIFALTKTYFILYFYANTGLLSVINSPINTLLPSYTSGTVINE